MLSLRNALLFSLVAVSAASQTNELHGLSKRTLSPVAKASIPPFSLKLSGVEWTPSMIAAKIDTAEGGGSTRRAFPNRAARGGPRIFEISGSLFEIDLSQTQNPGQYRAIVTSGNQLVGIVEYASGRQDSTIKVAFNVEEQKQIGVYLNGGSLPETINLQGGRVITRKAIAGAVYGRSRRRLGGYWIAEIPGQNGRHVGVVYDLARTEIIRLVEYSSPKHISVQEKQTTIYEPSRSTRRPSQDPKLRNGRHRHKGKKDCPLPVLGYIVSLKRGLPERVVRSHIEWVKTRKPDLRLQRTYHVGTFRGYAAILGDAFAREVRARREVAGVEREIIVDTTWLQYQNNAAWGLGSISNMAPDTRSTKFFGRTPFIYDSRAGEGTWAYVVDSGINIDHEEFRGGRAIPGVCTASDCPEKDDTEEHWGDDSGHGTHVAGTIGGKLYGVAKKATLVDVRVCDACGRTTTGRVMSGIDWAVRNITAGGRQGKSIINMSLGSWCPGKKFEDCIDHGRSDAKNAFFDGVFEQGVLVVAAAGNQALPAGWDSPRGRPSVVTVGAIDRNWQEASFSNYGEAVDILAPGVDIMSADSNNPERGTLNDGTSMATPHVSGVALCLQALEHFASPGALRQRILSMASGDAVVLSENKEGLGTGMKRQPPTTNLRLYNNPAYRPQNYGPSAPPNKAVSRPGSLGDDRLQPVWNRPGPQGLPGSGRSRPSSFDPTSMSPTISFRAGRGPAWTIRDHPQPHSERPDLRPQQGRSGPRGRSSSIDLSSVSPAISHRAHSGREEWRVRKFPQPPSEKPGPQPPRQRPGPQPPSEKPGPQPVDESWESHYSPSSIFDVAYRKDVGF